MADKKAKTAQKNPAHAQKSHPCPSCGAESKVTYFTGFGRKGFFWTCENDCGYSERTR